MPASELRTAWRPRSLTEGTDPDPRFTLANERTFLAWVRTALGIVAAALALEAFAGDLLPTSLRKVVAATLLISAALLVIAALYRWLRIEVAMRTGRSLPVPVIFGVLTLAFVGACVIFMSVLLP